MVAQIEAGSGRWPLAWHRVPRGAVDGLLGEYPACYTFEARHLRVPAQRLGGDSMPAYLIVNYTIDDADAYQSYQKGAGPTAIIEGGGKLLALDPASVSVEGGEKGSQTVVIEFESKERAREIYESAEYQAALPTRLGATSNHFAVLVDGFVMPS